jgi:hypothetical protein
MYQYYVQRFVSKDCGYGKREREREGEGGREGERERERKRERENIKHLRATYLKRSCLEQ